MKHGLFTEDAILTFEVWVIGSGCWPWRLKFMIAKWKSSWLCPWPYYLPRVHTFTTSYSHFNLLYHFGVLYLLNSFNKETLLLLLLLLLLLFHSRISGVIMTCKDSRCNQLQWTEAESFEIVWRQIRAKLGIFANPVGYSEGFEGKMENPSGRGGGRPGLE